jgi:RNA-binding protein YlmH
MKEDKQCELLLARLADLRQQVQRSGCCMATAFLDPAEMAVAKKFAHYEAGDLSFFVSGGYPEAERTVLFLCPNWLDAATEFRRKPPIAALSAVWSARFYTLGHRDLLGAILGLGLKRNQIGDILMSEGMAQVIVLAGIADYITQELKTAGRASVRVKLLDLAEVIPPVRKVKEIRTTVASPRLDSLLAAAFGMSRSKAVPLITAERVEVNYELVADPSFTVEEGAMLSVRGLGRAQLVALPGQTKKGRLIAVLERFL